jgi:DNA-binding MarR family transcriptional regulator
MLNADFYTFTQQVQGAMFAALYAGQAKLAEPLPALPPLLQVRSGYAESPGWFLVQAMEFDPEPLTVETLRVRDIYASERIVVAVLEFLAGEQWLKCQGNTYTLTDAGRAVFEQLRQRSLTLLTVMPDPLPTAQLDRLEVLLQRIIEASLQAATPPGTWCLAHSRQRAPAADAPLLTRLNQIFSDFNAFRDDAHMAAWQPHGIDGYAWEAFALICEGQVDSAAAVYQQLPFRGYSEAEYAAALQSLLERGWLTRSDNRYQVTETGRTIRAEVEQRTDAYFYGSWSVLGAGELEEVQGLLQQFQTRLQAMAEGG